MGALDVWRDGRGSLNRPPKPVEITPPVDLFTIESRNRIRVAKAGSQRRCYNGHFSDSDWEMVWGPWKTSESGMPASRIEFWRGLNLGAQTKSEYRLIPE